jgi:hypothetical protein
MYAKFQTDILYVIKNSMSLYSKGNCVRKDDYPNAVVAGRSTTWWLRKCIANEFFNNFRKIVNFL